jgi:hypothetical protein
MECIRRAKWKGPSYWGISGCDTQLLRFGAWGPQRVRRVLGGAAYVLGPPPPPMFVCPKGEGVPRGAVTLTATPVSRFASVSLRFGRCGCRLNMALNNWSYSTLTLAGSGIAARARLRLHVKRTHVTLGRSVCFDLLQDGSQVDEPGRDPPQIDHSNNPHVSCTEVRTRTP